LTKNLKKTYNILKGKQQKYF